MLFPTGDDLSTIMGSGWRGNGCRNLVLGLEGRCTNQSGMYVQQREGDPEPTL